MSVPFRIEVCVENTDGLIAAQNAGADRVELCASLIEGGLTPSWGMIHRALDLATVPFHPIIRNRGGDFLYSQVEFDAMLADVRSLRGTGVAGVVIGCLHRNGTFDEDRMKRLVDASGEMSVTSHRAFDMTRDPEEAVEALVRCGVDRVLTSGHHDTASEGIEVLSRVKAAASGRLVVMACGGLREDNIARVRAAAEPDEMHFAALMQTPSAMDFRNAGIGMGGNDLEREYTNTVTDEATVRRIIAAAKGT